VQRSVVPQEDIASFLHHASCRPGESIVKSSVNRSLCAPHGTLLSYAEETVC
jgi:hypothetical protein